MPLLLWLVWSSGATYLMHIGSPFEAIFIMLLIISSQVVK